MTCPGSVSRFRWLRRLCSVACAVFGCCALPAARAQSPDIEKPLLNIDDDISAFAFAPDGRIVYSRSEEHTSELQSPCNLVCRLLLEKKKYPSRSGAHINCTTRPQQNTHPPPPPRSTQRCPTVRSKSTSTLSRCRSNVADACAYRSN